MKNNKKTDNMKNNKKINIQEQENVLDLTIEKILNEDENFSVVSIADDSFELPFESAMEP